jgi:hypothetical protein
MVGVPLGHEGSLMAQEERDFVAVHPSLDQLGGKAGKIP